MEQNSEKQIVHWEADLDWLIADLLVFYKGGFSYTELNNLPLPLLYDYYKIACKMNKDAERAAKQKRF